MTYLFPRNTSNIILNRRYQVNDKVIRYKKLAANLFSDTVFAYISAGKSVINFIYSSVFETNPLAFDRDNHIIFKKIFKDVVVPTDMIIDEAKYQIEG